MSKPKIEKNRYWTFIAYPDSAPANWIQLLTETGLPVAISPLHDKDINETTEEQKKPHWHILLAWDGPTTASVADRVSKMVNGTISKPVASVKGAYDYFIHKNNPEKYQYDDADRTNLNGFNIYNYASLTTEEDILLKKQIFSFIIQNDINEYFILCTKLAAEDLVAFDYVTKHTLLFDRFICSRRNFQNQQIKEIIGKKDID